MVAMTHLWLLHTSCTLSPTTLYQRDQGNREHDDTEHDGRYEFGCHGFNLLKKRAKRVGHKKMRNEYLCFSNVGLDILDTKGNEIDWTERGENENIGRGIASSMNTPKKAASLALQRPSVRNLIQRHRKGHDCLIVRRVGTTVVDIRASQPRLSPAVPWQHSKSAPCPIKSWVLLQCVCDDRKNSLALMSRICRCVRYF